MDNTAKTYLQILDQSLDKKINVLNRIIEQDQIQLGQLQDPNLDPDDFDQTVEKKAKLIEELELLDDGFEQVFARVKDEIGDHKDAYKAEIRRMQEKIRQITAKSMEIQTQEARNKNMMEQKFNSIHKQVKEIRQSQKVVNQYYRNMMKNAYTDPQFLDNKK